jgi:hypothetical protein
MGMLWNFCGQTFGVRSCFATSGDDQADQPSFFPIYAAHDGTPMVAGCAMWQNKT